MLATVLAAVVEFGGPDVSKTCSKLVSVSLSFGGVMSAGGSEGSMPGEGGVFGTSGSATSKGIGGGSPGRAVSSALGRTGTGVSVGIS